MDPNDDIIHSPLKERKEVKMVERVSRVRHLTESLPLSVYNHVFSRQPELNGAVCYYDATMDVYIDELPLSRASEIKIVESPKKDLLRFD